MGLPGFSGFVAELQVLIGALQTYPSCTLLAGFGILVGVAYTLRALQKSFFSDYGTHSDGPIVTLPPITLAEKAGAVLLMGATLLIGLYPRLLLDFIIPSLHSPELPWMHSLITGGKP